MPSMYERVVAVVDRPPDLRTDFECQEFVPWIRNKATLFKSVKPEIVKEVIKNCDFEKKNVDDVIIRQGDHGDRLYIVLRGKVSIYVIQDKDNEGEVVTQVEQACSSKKKLDRTLLGTHVWTSGEGQAFGEVALIKEDCIRTASVVVDEESDLLVVDKALYNRSVRDVMEQEYNEKTEFVERNPMFQAWSAKQKKHLVISLRKESVHYGCRISKQGSPAKDMFFILRGEVEIVLDQAAYKPQFPLQWAELTMVLPELLTDKKNLSVSPHEQLRNRRTGHKSQPICLLGENEHLGALEMVLGLDSHIETATSTAACELLMLRRHQYERIFKRKYAISAVEKLKEDLATRLCLYIHQTNRGSCAFLKFLNMKLEDQRLLRTLKETKSRNALKGKRSLLAAQPISTADVHDDAWALILKRLHMRHDTTVSLPAASATELAISKMEGRLRGWVERSRLHLPAVRNDRTVILPEDMKLIDEALS